MRFQSKSEAFFFWLGLLVMSFFVMAQPAQASGTVANQTGYEVIPPISDVWIDGQGYPANTPGAACTFRGLFPDNTVGATFWYGFQGHLCNPNGVNIYHGYECTTPAVPTALTEFTAECRRPLTGCPSNATATGPTCTCNSGYVPSADATACVFDCPHTFLGLAVSRGYVLSTVNRESYEACDSFGCAVQVVKVGSVFGVTMLENLPQPIACPNSNQPNNPPATVLTVTFTDPVERKTKFEDVVQKALDAEYAAQVAAAKRMAAETAAQNAKEAVDRLKVSVELLKAAAAEKDQAAKNVRDAGQRFVANPTQANLDDYNGFVREFNRKTSVVTPLLTRVESEKKVAQAAVENAGQATAELGDINTKLGALQTAVNASGEAFDPTELNGKLGELGAAQTALAGALAKLGTAQADINTTTTMVNTITNTIINNNTTVNNTTVVVQAAVPGIPPVPDGGGGGGGTASGVPAVEVPATEDPPPTPSFCEENPTAEICKPETVPAKAGGALPSIGTGSWYEKKYPDGLAGVFSTNFETMKNTPLAGLMTQLVPTISGGAHSGCFTIPVWNMGDMQLCIPPGVLTALGIFMLLTALFGARAIIFGG